MSDPSNPYDPPHSDPEQAYGEPMDAATRNWAVTLHLMQYANAFAPPAGLILVILIWMLKKDELPGLDAHGRAATNWMVSLFIYLLISGLLCIVLIGVPFVILFGLLGIIFPALGAIKAGAGEVWKYPLSIRFV